MLPQTALRVRDARAGESLLVRDPYFTRDFIHVRDVARAFVALSIALEPPATVDIGTGAGTTVLALAQKLVEASGKPLALSPEEAPSGTFETSVADIRALEAIGWRVRQSLDEAVRSVWEGLGTGPQTR